MTFVYLFNYRYDQNEAQNYRLHVGSEDFRELKGFLRPPNLFISSILSYLVSLRYFNQVALDAIFMIAISGFCSGVLMFAD